LFLKIKRDLHLRPSQEWVVLLERKPCKIICPLGKCGQEKNQAQGPDRRFSLRYKRKQKPKTCGKEKLVTDGSDGNQPTYKFVYKRRRIQASRDSLDSTQLKP